MTDSGCILTVEAVGATPSITWEWTWRSMWSVRTLRGVLAMWLLLGRGGAVPRHGAHP